MSYQTVRVTIDRLSYGPAGVGRVDGKVLFVPGTVPGDEVEVAIEEEKKNYARGRVVEVIVPAPQRRNPPCPYVTQCGGCPWQHMTYVEQLRAKESGVREQLQRIGGIVDPPVLPIIAAPAEWHYRHRIRLRVDDRGRLGFSPSQSHDIVEVNSCLIADEDNALQLQVARAWVAALQTKLRQVEIVTQARLIKDKSFVLIGEADGLFRSSDNATCVQLLQTYPSMKGLLLTGPGWRQNWGDLTVAYDLGVADLSLRMRRGTFTQANPAGNRQLIATLLQLGAFHSKQQVIELYCGMGNFSLPIARRAASLIGIESVHEAVADAQANAAQAKITNVQFLRASAREGMQQLLRRGTRCDVLVLDPPRVGAAEVIEDLPRVAAQKIVYVSCDPSTLARDLHRLQGHGYHLQVAQPLDLFPQTYHVETIAVCVLT